MPDASAAIRFALSQLGKPYLWGATGPDSYDCSGLIQTAYSKSGISIPRTTQAMLADPHLQTINAGQLQPGDLIFPSTEHVQMYLGGGKVVEAPRSGLNVRVVNVGTIYAARRVTTPASGDYSGYGGNSSSPIADTVPIGNTAINASDVSQAVGVGFTDAFADLLKPVLQWLTWMLLAGIGLASMSVAVLLMGKNTALGKTVNNALP